ncbi:DUF58 domain-containing protein [Palaeococcus ferrophilus]|uniref:DUF58 domain-containing protein n=1 Tax=Palaeococcus ferrophilus TaxID=83868 RepID=UPI00064ED3FC|nr:DUF58 domain-containing protein [Palaeococcus ferrophilus]
MIQKLLSWALWFLVVGIVFMIPELGYLAIIPLGVVALGILLDAPGNVSVERVLGKGSVRVGEEVEVKVRARVASGIGVFLLRQNLPEEFVLVEGSNVGAFFKGFRPVEVELSFRVKASRRGRYELPGVEFSGHHLLGLKPSRWGVYGGSKELTVMPLVTSPRRVRTPTTKSPIPIPTTSLSVRGSLSTDFREIREYRPGDPLKFVNWKASARKGKAMVNEFEREGKKTVMFYVDARDVMNVGTSVENPFEYAIQLVSSLSYYFTRRGYNIGLYVIGLDTLLPPATGSKQLYEIVKTLLELENFRAGEESLEEAIGKTKRILLSYTPLVVYVSNLLERNAGEVKGTVKKLRAIYKSARLPFLVFDISTYSLLGGGPEKLVRLEKRAIHHELAGAAYIMPWDPGKEDVSTILTKTVRLIR